MLTETRNIFFPQNPSCCNLSSGFLGKYKIRTSVLNPDLFESPNAFSLSLQMAIILDIGLTLFEICC